MVRTKINSRSTDSALESLAPSTPPESMTSTSVTVSTHPPSSSPQLSLEITQAVAKAFTESLPGILAAIQGSVPASTSVANSNSVVSSMLFSTAPGGSSQPGSSGISVPPFISTFSTLANPVFSFPLSSASSVVPVPSTSISLHVVSRNFMVGPGYAPILTKLVSKITGGSFVELADLLPNNLKMADSESRTYSEGKLLVTPSKKRAVEITDIVTWVEAFSIYMLVLCALHPAFISAAASVNPSLAAKVPTSLSSLTCLTPFINPGDLLESSSGSGEVPPQFRVNSVHTPSCSSALCSSWLGQSGP